MVRFDVKIAWFLSSRKLKLLNASKRILLNENCTTWQIGDLIGTAFLALSFLVLQAVGDSFLQSLEVETSGTENVTVVNLATY